MKTLILTRCDILNIVDIREVIDVVELAFKEKGLKRVQMPPKIYLFFSKYNGDLRAMPAYLEALDIAGVKVVNVHPDNPKLHNLPTVMATIVLIDPKTGFPLAIMDGTHITNLRTGAAGAIASKYLARKNSEVLGVIGAGTQGRTLTMAHLAIFNNIREVKVYDISREAINRYVSEIENYVKKLGINVKLTICDKIEDVVKESDIVCTATPSRKPIVMNDWVREGTHFNCIGADAPGKQELDPKILKRAKIVVDDFEQAIHSGEVNVPISQGILSKDEIYGELGEIIAGLKPGRVSESEVTVFTSTGLAIQDVIVAKLVYDKAKSKNLGIEVNLVLV